MKRKLITLLLTLSMAFTVLCFVGCNTENSNNAQSSVSATLPSTDNSTPSSSERPPTTEHTHDYIAHVTAPTCTTRGYTTYTCACGDTYIDDYVNAKGHSYAATVTQPTCTAQGYTTHACACGDTYINDYVNAKGHSYTTYLSDGNATYEADGTKTAFCDHGCGTTDTITDMGSMLVHSGITFKSFTVSKVNDATYNAYGKMANGTKVFSFLNEITVNGTASYTVSRDLAGQYVIPTKTVNVNTGNNTFYVLATVENDLILYTVTVRVRPIYTVKFDTLGGSDVCSQQIEEDDFAEAPDLPPTKTGYTFGGWNFNFANTPITDDTTVAIHAWQANTYTVYFDGNGGSSHENITVTYDTAYGELPVPKRESYVFVGWFTALNEGSKIGCDTIVATDGDHTLYARWDTEVTYALNFFASAYEVTGLTDATASEIIIFNTYNDKPVTSIRASAFSGCTALRSVTVEEGVTSIGEKAFYNCSNLTNIKLPSTLTEIGGEAFYNCTSLQCNAYDNALYLGNDTSPHLVLIKAVSTNISTCTIANSTTIIYYEAFKDCALLTDVVVPDGVLEIGASAFKNCSTLKNATIAKSVKWIGLAAFYGCSLLETLVLPLVFTVSTTYGYTYYYPFGYIFGLANFENAVATKQEYTYTFDEYDGTVSTYATSKTFYIPKTLKTVVVNGGRMRIGTFFGCNNIKTIVINSIAEYAFYGCSSIQTVYYCGTQTNWNYYKKYYNTNNSNYAIFNTGVDVYYYSEEEPPLNSSGTAYDGKYWYYATDGTTPVVWKKT